MLLGLAGWGLKGLLPTPVVTSLVTDLVNMHVAYSRIDVPVEFASASGREVREWFQERLGSRVVVPDYTPAGIRLVGGRIAETEGHPTTYLVYEKGHTLMSVFVVKGASARFAGPRTTFRGSTYEAIDIGGQHGVFWAEDGRTFAVVSSLEYGDLLQCADRLRTEWQAERNA
jgi:anti-sigma factor RsiW